MTHDRAYSAVLAGLGLITAASAVVLLFLHATGGTVDTVLSAWSLVWVAAVCSAYVLAIVATLAVRTWHPATGRRWTRALNWALLPAVPGGTLVGLYGLLCADRIGSRR